MNYKEIIGVIAFLIAFIGAGYIAFWWGLVDPIMELAEAIDDDLVSATLVAKQVIKFLVREFLAVVWFLFFIIISKILIFQ